MHPRALVEAALFVSEKPLSLQKLAEVTGLPQSEVSRLLIELKEDLSKKERGIMLAETPEGYELRLKPEYRDKVVKLAPFSDISEGMLRSLAIIAAKQPVRQSVIVRYQGNKAYGYIVSLEQKGLIKTEKFGRTKIITTTPEFEKYFGKSSAEIKSLLEEKKG
jgi:segregation and condensation protein B